MLRYFLLLLFLYLALPVAARDRPDLKAIKALADNVELLAEHEGPFADELFAPLVRLAKLQLNFDLEEDALETLKRAQNIAHRNDGVYSKRQLPIIELLKKLALKKKGFEDANRQKKFAFFITTHAFDRDAPETLSAYAELANWYMQTGQPRRARKVIEDAIEIAKAIGQDPLPFYIADNQALRLGGNCCNPKKLIRKLAEQSHSNPTDTLSAAYLEIADTLILGGKAQRAYDYYELANKVMPLNTSTKPIAFRRSMEASLLGKSISYEVIGNMPLSTQNQLRRMTRQEQIEASFNEPQWFRFDPEDKHQGFETRDLGQAHNLEKRTYAMVGHPFLFSEDQLDQLLPLRFKKNKEKLSIKTSFTVIETGDLKDIKIVESNAPNRLNRLLIQVLRRTYYRPGLKFGKPIVSQGVTLVQTFVPKDTTE